MDENDVLRKNQLPLSQTSVIKKRVLPLSDSQIIQSPEKKEKRQHLDNKIIEKNTILSPSPHKIDIDKELQSFLNLSEANSPPISNYTSLPKSISSIAFESVATEPHHTPSELQSIFQSNSTNISNEYSQSSSQTPSSSESKILSQDSPIKLNNIGEMLKQITEIVKNNRCLLNNLVNASSSSTDLSSAEIHDLRYQLEEETKKNATLTDMLEKCIADNDSLAETAETLRSSLNKHCSSEIEYTMLYKTASIESKQAEENVQAIRKECSDLKDSLNIYKQELIQLKKEYEENESFKILSREERLAYPQPPRLELSDKEIEAQLKELNTYRFTNQLLVQQLAEERKKRTMNNKEDEMRQQMKSLTNENTTLKSKLKEAEQQIEEMKEVLSKTDLTDYQIISFSSED